MDQIMMHKLKTLVQTHWAAGALAFVVALIVLTPNYLLWKDAHFQGMEMMMLDAENHYLARIAEVSQGHSMASNTFLANKNIPYATPPLGEVIIAWFGKIIHQEPARAAVLSTPLSVFAITLLIYVFAFALSRHRSASLLAAAVPMLGYNLIGLSPEPFLSFLHGSPSGGPFIFFSRLVNPSISGIILFAVLLLVYREFFERERSTWWKVVLAGVLIGISLYITPFTYTFLGLVVLLTFVWFLVRREYTHAFPVFVCGTVALLVSIPFFINYSALVAVPGYEHLGQFLGIVHRREFILGALLPLMVFASGVLWPKQFHTSGRTFFLILCGALLVVLNQQLITGTLLQPGHYHWYITKPLAGILGGLLVGYWIERFVPEKFSVARSVLVVLLLAALAYNSMGFLAPWFESTRANAYRQQSYGPLVEYLKTIPAQQEVWADEETSDFIPIYTVHDVPNSINVGSYPIPESFFEDRLFLEYRLRGILPKEFETTIRAEAHHVGDRLWGLWLREQFGDPSAVPEEEFKKLSQGYAAFYMLPWHEAFSTLGITLVVARTQDAPAYSKIRALKEQARVGDFVIFNRI